MVDWLLHTGITLAVVCCPTNTRVSIHCRCCLMNEVGSSGIHQTPSARNRKTKAWLLVVFMQCSRGDMAIAAQTLHKVKLHWPNVGAVRLR